MLINLRLRECAVSGNLKRALATLAPHRRLTSR